MSSRVSHEQIVNHLRTRINAGVLKRGDRLPSFEQLHRQFGAASMTIGRAFDVLEADGLVERRPSRGMYVAQSLQRKSCARIGAIGVVTGQPTDYWSQFLSGLHTGTDEAKVELALAPDVGSLRWDEYDAVLGFGWSILPIFQSRPDDMPVVAVGVDMHGVPSFAVNEFEACFLATRHLIELGHERICFLAWETAQSTRIRLAGHHDAFGGTNTAFDANLFRPLRFTGRLPLGKENVEQTSADHWKAAGFTNVGGSNMDDWIAEGFANLGCTAMIVQNALIAEGVMKQLQFHGYRVPDDISVIAFDNEKDCATMSPPLSSVGGDMFDLARRAVKCLLNQMAGKPVPRNTTLLPVALHARGSTGPCPQA